MCCVRRPKQQLASCQARTCVRVRQREHTSIASAGHGSKCRSESWVPKGCHALYMLYVQSTAQPFTWSRSFIAQAWYVQPNQRITSHLVLACVYISAGHVDDLTVGLFCRRHRLSLRQPRLSDQHHQHHAARHDVAALGPPRTSHNATTHCVANVTHT